MPELRFGCWGGPVGRFARLVARLAARQAVGSHHHAIRTGAEGLHHRRPHVLAGHHHDRGAPASTPGPIAGARRAWPSRRWPGSGGTAGRGSSARPGTWRGRAARRPRRGARGRGAWCGEPATCSPSPPAGVGWRPTPAPPRRGTARPARGGPRRTRAGRTARSRTGGRSRAGRGAGGTGTPPSRRPRPGAARAGSSRCVLRIPSHQLPVGRHGQLGGAGPRHLRGPLDAGLGQLLAAPQGLVRARGRCRRRPTGSTSTARPPATSSVLVPREVTTGGALRHRLQHRQAEALAQARVGRGPPHRRTGRAAGRGVTKPSARTVATGRRRRRPSRSVRPGPARGRRARPGRARTPRPGGAGSCGARPCRRRARRAGRGRSCWRASATSAAVARSVRTPSGTRRSRASPTPCAARSAHVAIDEHSTRSASRRRSSRPRWKVRSPRRVKWLGLVEEGEVVHGHDQRGRSGRDDDRGGVDDVDPPGRQLDPRPPQPVPRLVERGPRQRQRAHRHDRPERRRAEGPGGPRSHRRPRRRRGRGPHATTSSAATAVPPGTRCQHCSRVTAARTADHPGRRRRRSMLAR